MNNPPLDRETMIKVYKNGTYYNPASKRYGPDANVVCDRCKKSKLDVCIGLQIYDLCLACVQEINELLKKKPVTTLPPGLPECSRNPPLTRMIQSQFRPPGSSTSGGMRTNMLQNQFRPNDIATLMVQNQFRPNDDVKSYMQVNQFRYPVTDIRAEMKQNKFIYPEEIDDDDMMSFMIQNQFRK